MGDVAVEAPVGDVPVEVPQPPVDPIAAAAPERIYDEIPLAEMEFVEDDGMYYYDCPCGDVFELSKEDLEAGKNIAKCPSCSLKIRVLLP